MSDKGKRPSATLGPRRGANQGTMRARNAQLVLQLVRERGVLTKAEATRATGLSANAISVIFRALENDGLLLRGEPTRGRIGQPSIPFRINPDFHHYVALKVGRRSLELAAVNFAGEIVLSKRRFLPFPTPGKTLAFVREQLDALLASAGLSKTSISGLAIAMPFELWSWTEEFDAPSAEMQTWRDFDVARELGELVPWPVVVENDATAACRAEVVFGDHADKQDWIYFFVGAFIGGGIVMNGTLFSGRRGTAGGFAPMRVPDQAGGNRLIDHASLVVLERKIRKNGGNPLLIYQKDPDWSGQEPLVEEWIIGAARNLAQAIISSLSVIDFEAVVIEGAIPEDMKSRLVSEVRAHLRRSDLQGVLMPKIEAGQIGRQARTIGAAAALISKAYLADPREGRRFWGDLPFDHAGL